jgi:nucleoside-diphosphate-sugar epimerase
MSLARDAPLLVLGAGYVGAALADRALRAGREVVLADNWYATRREQVEPLGARVETVDIRRAGELDELFSEPWSRVYLLAAQASRPLAFADPDYTEETNVMGVRRVAERVQAPLVYASSLHVYGPSQRGEVGPGHPYGPQSDLSHLSKVYGELCLDLHARRRGFPLAILRLGIAYGPSPVEHERPESQTVVDKFRRLAAAGEPLPVDDPDATIGVVHVDDAARILLEAPEHCVENVAAESVTVSDVAALARGEEPRGGAPATFVSPFSYEHRLADYVRP